MAGNEQQLAILFAAGGVSMRVMRVMYESALRAKERLHGNQDVSLCVTLQHISSLYFQSGDHKNAQSYTQRAVDIYDVCAGGTESLSARLTLGSILLASKQEVEALPHLEKSVQMMQGVIGVGSWTQSTLASAWMKVGMAKKSKALEDYLGANEAFQKSLQLRKLADQKEHEANLCSLIGLNSMALKDFPNAARYLQQCLDLRIHLNGAENKVVALTYNNLAVVRKAQGDVSGAIVCLEFSLDIWTKIAGKDDLSVALAASNLGCMLQLQGKIESARACFEQCLDIRQRVLGVKHKLSLRAVQQLAQLLLEAGLHDEEQALARDWKKKLKHQRSRPSTANNRTKEEDAPNSLTPKANDVTAPVDHAAKVEALDTLPAAESDTDRKQDPPMQGPEATESTEQQGKTEALDTLQPPPDPTMQRQEVVASNVEGETSDESLAQKVEPKISTDDTPTEFESHQVKPALRDFLAEAMHNHKTALLLVSDQKAETAIVVLQEGLDLIGNHSVSGTDVEIQIKTLLGTLLCQNSNWTLGIETLHRAVDSAESTNGEELENVWRTIASLCQEQSFAEAWTEGEAALGHVVGMVQLHREPDVTDIFSLYSQRAGFLLKLQDAKGAVNMLESAYRIKQDQDEENARLCSQICVLHRQLSQDTAAISWARHAVDIWSSLDNSSIELTVALIDLADVLLATGDAAAAETCFLRTWTIRKQIFSSSSKKTIIALEKLTTVRGLLYTHQITVLQGMIRYSLSKTKQEEVLSKCHRLLDAGKDLLATGNAKEALIMLREGNQAALSSHLCTTVQKEILLTGSTALTALTRHDEGCVWLQQCLFLVSNVVLPRDIYVINQVRILLANMLIQCHKGEDAVSLLKEAQIDLKTSTESSSFENAVNNHPREGMDLQEALSNAFVSCGDFLSAAESLELCVPMHESLNSSDEDRGHLLSRLGMLYSNAPNQSSLACMRLAEALRLLGPSLRDTEEFSDILFLLGTAQQKSQQYYNAAASFEHCFQIRNTVLGPALSSPATADAHLKYLACLDVKNEMAVVLQRHVRALLCTNMQPWHSVCKAHRLQDDARALMVDNNFETAEGLVSEALLILGEHCEKDATRIANMLIFKGELLQCLGRSSEYVEARVAAYTLQENDAGPSPHLAESWSQVGLLLMNPEMCPNESQALVHLTHAVDMWKQIFPDAKCMVKGDALGVTMCGAVSKLGVLQSRFENHKDAVLTISLALSMHVSRQSTDSNEIGELWYHLGRSQQGIGLPKKAERSLLNALRVMSQSNFYSELCALCLSEISGLFGKQNRFSSAIATMERCVKIRLRISGEDSDEYKECLSTLASMIHKNAAVTLQATVRRGLCAHRDVKIVEDRVVDTDDLKQLLEPALDDSSQNSSKNHEIVPSKPKSKEVDSIQFQSDFPTSPWIDNQESEVLPSPNSHKEFERLFLEARTLSDCGRYQESATLFRQLIDNMEIENSEHLWPLAKQAHSLHAMSLIQLGDKEGAAEALIKFLSLFSDGQDPYIVAKAWSRVGMLFFQSPFDNASEMATHALESSVLNWETLWTSQTPSPEQSLEAERAFTILSTLLAQAGRATEAVEIVEKGLHLLVNLNAATKVEMLKRVGTLQFSLGHYRQAKEAFSTGLQHAFQCVKGPRRRDMIGHLLWGLGICYEAQEQYSHAIQVLNRCCEIRNVDKDSPSSLASATQNRLQLVMKKQHIAASTRIQAACRSMVIHRNFIGANDRPPAQDDLEDISSLAPANNVRPEDLDAHKALAFGTYFKVQNNMSEALPFFHQASLQFEKLLGNSSSVVAKVLRVEAEALLSLGRIENAADLFVAAIAVDERGGSSKTTVAVDCTRTAFHYSSLKSATCYAKAEGLFNKAISLWEEEFPAPMGPPKDRALDVEVSISGLSKQKEEQQDIRMATRLAEKAFVLQVRALGDTHKQSQTCAHRISSLRQALGDNTNAIIWKERALNAELVREGETHAASNLLFELGCLHIDTNNLDDAAVILQRCYNVRKDLLGPKAKETAIVVTKLAEVRVKMKSPKQLPGSSTVTSPRKKPCIVLLASVTSSSQAQQITVAGGKAAGRFGGLAAFQFVVNASIAEAGRFVTNLFFEINASLKEESSAMFGTISSGETLEQALNTAKRIASLSPNRGCSVSATIFKSIEKLYSGTSRDHGDFYSLASDVVSPAIIQDRTAKVESPAAPAPSLERQAQCSQWEDQLVSQMTAAAGVGDVIAVRELLLGGSAQLRCANGDTALMYAVESRSTTCVELLLKNGALVDSIGSDGNTALICAAFQNDVDIVEILLKHKAWIDRRGQDGDTALMFAASQGHEATVSLLLSAGADIDLKDDFGRNAASFAKLMGKPKIASQIASSSHHSRSSCPTEDTIGLKIDRQQYSTMTTKLADALCGACQAGNVDAAASVLKGVQPSAFSPDGTTALHCAATNNHLNVVRVLVGAGATMSARDLEGNTALILASGQGHLQVVEYLLKQGSAVAAFNNLGETALTVGMRNSHSAVVALLCNFGAAALETEAQKEFSKLQTQKDQEATVEQQRREKLQGEQRRLETERLEQERLEAERLEEEQRQLQQERELQQKQLEEAQVQSDLAIAELNEVTRKQEVAQISSVDGDGGGDGTNDISVQSPKKESDENQTKEIASTKTPTVIEINKCALSVSPTTKQTTKGRQKGSNREQLQEEHAATAARLRAAALQEREEDERLADARRKNRVETELALIANVLRRVEESRQQATQQQPHINVIPHEPEGTKNVATNDWRHAASLEMTEENASNRSALFPDIVKRSSATAFVQDSLLSAVNSAEEPILESHFVPVAPTERARTAPSGRNPRKTYQTNSSVRPSLMPLPPTDKPPNAPEPLLFDPTLLFVLNGTQSTQSTQGPLENTSSHALESAISQEQRRAQWKPPASRFFSGRHQS